VSGNGHQRRIRQAAIVALLLSAWPATASPETTRLSVAIPGTCAVPDEVPADFEALFPDAVSAEMTLEEGPELLRALVEVSPASLGSLSIGSPDAGLLLNPIPFPPGPLWIIRNPLESYATAETIAFIAAAVETVEQQFPGTPRLVIGDISRADGGRLNRHRSHQSGRDADIGFYYRTGEAPDFSRASARNLDVERTWALARALVVETDVERIFVDRSIQHVLYAHALSIGEDRGWLEDIFGRRTAGVGAIIQHERRHQDHLHVRFFNRRAQDCGRLAYPHLVRAGVLPGPTVKHTVRSGETLSHLAGRYGTSVAAIRAANGLRGTGLRAGHRYVIPVRRVPTLSEPVVVPPRRLPPGLQVVASTPLEASADALRSGSSPESR
jgi:murein endopeptidase